MVLKIVVISMSCVDDEFVKAGERLLMNEDSECRCRQGW
jgi:hypothetical protein